MDEAEWLASIVPGPMLVFLRGQVTVGHRLQYPPEYERKLVLFGCACCRRFCHLLVSKSFQGGLEIAERRADGLASAAERRRAARFANEGIHYWRITHHLWEPADTGADRERANLRYEAFTAVCGVACGRNPMQSAERASAVAIRTANAPEEEGTLHCAWLRDLFGNPFRPVATRPAWLSWHDGLLVSMARQMYDSRDFTDMPILADAMEEAGCTDQDFLAHCRSGGEHVRGCWVVDLLLGKS